MICCREGCGREAVSAPKVCVPAVAERMQFRAAASLVLALPCCEPCLRAMTAGDLIGRGDPGRDKLRGLLARASSVELDFAEAWVAPVDLADPAYLVAERAMRGSAS